MRDGYQDLDRNLSFKVPGIWIYYFNVLSVQLFMKAHLNFSVCSCSHCLNLDLSSAFLSFDVIYLSVLIL